MRNNRFHILYDILHYENLPYVPLGHLSCVSCFSFLRLLLLQCAYTAANCVVFSFFLSFLRLVYLRVNLNAVGENIKKIAVNNVGWVLSLYHVTVTLI